MSDGQVVASNKAYMVILPIKNFYDHYSTGFGELSGVFANAEDVHKDFSPSYEYVPIAIEQDPDYQKVQDDYVMMVHGWRMQYTERVNFGETAFKRLYWAGYKGRFGLFSWPTGYFEKPAHVYSAYELVGYLNGNAQNYGDSEALARVVGRSLSSLMADLSSDMKVHVFAHSMGNVVVSEAFRNSNYKIAEQYIASQAAEVASSYYPHQQFIRYVDPISGFEFADPEGAWRHNNANGLDTEFDMPPNYYSYDVPAMHGATSPSLELDASAREGWGPAYYANILSGVGRVINFHNRQDKALEGWEFNQLTKPDLNDGPTWAYSFVWNCPYGAIECAIDVYPDHEDGERVTDIYQRGDELLTWRNDVPISKESADILGHIVPSRTNALGQVSAIGVGSVIGGNVDLNGAASRFGSSNQGHSAQYYQSYANRKLYWERIIEYFELLDR